MSHIASQADSRQPQDARVRSRRGQHHRGHQCGRRPGIILLMMVIILVLFSMVCVTWVITARQYKEVSTASASFERYDSGFETLLDEAFMQVIRGSSNPYSAIGPHSLLEDKYGNDRYDSTRENPGPPPVLANASLFAGGALTRLEFEEQFAPSRLSKLNDYYNGCLLTLNSDPIVGGNTVRVVDYEVDLSGANPVLIFVVESFPAGLLPQTGTFSELLVNGREFNGSGFVLADASGAPFMPNPGGTDPRATAPIFDFAGGYAPNGADESYDLPDWNNMILAARVWDEELTRWRVLLPSLHRPDYMNFAVDQGATPQDARNYMFRPSTDPTNGHPDFALNNPELSLAIEQLFNGNTRMAGALLTDPADANMIAYDVDNDGDGEADSVWVDLGFPAQTAADGRMYKPLFAILVTEMDSRLNVNYHGTQDLTLEENPSIGAYLATHSTTSAPVAGLGEGPADVSLQSFLSRFEINGGEGLATYARLLYGNLAVPIPSDATAQAMEGRYGELHRAQLTDYDLPSPGVNNVHDVMSAIQNNDFRNWRRRYNSPPDMRAVDRVGATIDGEIRHSSLGAAGVLSDPQIDNPYEFNADVTRKQLMAGGVAYTDRPYGPQELEVMLRYPDGDFKQAPNGVAFGPTGLEDRLRRMLELGIDTTTPNGRRVQGSLTTNSTDSSAPNIHWTPDMLQAAAADPNLNALIFGLPGVIDGAPSPSIVDLVRFRIAQMNPALADVSGAMYPQPLNDMTNLTIHNPANPRFGYFLSPDLLSGTRMDINRPFGNNKDDLDTGATMAGNGVIDEGHNAYMGPDMGYGSPYYDPTVVGAAGRADLIGEADSQNVTQPVWEFYAEAIDMTVAGVIYNYNQFFDDGNWTPDPGDYPGYSMPPMQDVNHDFQPVGTMDAREHLARHDYSRHLFCLMMTLKSQDPASPLNQFSFAPMGSLPQMAGENDPEFTTYRLAQWAANAADYMDRDSIMSAFEYDASPFTDDDGDPSNGTWDVDGDITTIELDASGSNPLPSRRVIWGMERPTMTLQETWAFHDVRTRDTNTDDGIGDYTAENSTPGADPDFDQTRMPQGSIFIELYCAVNGVVPSELRPEPLSPWGTTRFPENVVDLSRLAPPGMDDAATIEDETIRRPIWRMVVAERNTDLSSPNEPNPVNALRPTINPLLNGDPGSSVLPLITPQATDPNAISRVVWFTSYDAYLQQTGVAPEAVDPRVYYSDLQFANASLADDQRDFGNVVNFGFDDPGTRDAAMRMFHVAPSQYAVVGPRVTTKIGHSFPEAGEMPLTVFEDKPNETIIQLLAPDLVPDALGFPRPVVPISDAGVVGTGIYQDLSVAASPDYPDSYKSPDWTNTNNQNPAAAEEQDRVVRRPVGIVINGPRVPGGVGRRFGRGLSISEPDPITDPNYYRQPDAVTGATPPMPITIDNFDSYEVADDTPFDSGGNIAQAVSRNAVPASGPFFGPYQPGAVPEALFLQRLANPLAPYHAVYNPYITMDAMDLDLSAYNGEEPLSHSEQQGTEAPEILMSRQKTGELFNPTTNSLTQELSMWGYFAAVDYPQSGAAAGTPVARGNHIALHSLGHVNGLYNGAAFATPLNDHLMDNTAVPGVTLSNEAISLPIRAGHAIGLAEHIAYTLTAEQNPVPTAAVPSDRVANGDLQGDPFYQVILTLALEQTISNTQEWANNAVAPPLSTMVVPPANETGPGGLFIGQPLRPNGVLPPSLAWNDRPYISAFGLMNVPATSPERFARDFSTRGNVVSPYAQDQMLPTASYRHLLDFFQQQDTNNQYSNFHHLFEYVAVPSRFGGAETILNPQTSAPLYAPFNSISNFREHGKMNISTLLEPGEQFAAALNDEFVPALNDWAYNAATVFWNLRRSRKGYGNLFLNPFDPARLDFEYDPGAPSFFGQPFKGFANEIAQTFMRADGQQPLLAGRSTTDPNNGLQLGSNPANPVPVERDGDRSASFRHEPFNKLGNIMTTRSNVYSVWITVGFFEVTGDPNSSAREVYPDGMRLGRELGLDDGSYIRHRMFGIIDRSKPTAFVRGLDLNARETILLKRVVE